MDKSLAKHLNFYREVSSYHKSIETPNSNIIKRIPDLVFSIFYNKLTEPTLSEGFSEICEVNFIPEFNDNEIKLFLQKNE